MSAPVVYTDGLYEARIRCECCNLPTLRVPVDQHLGQHFEQAERVCGLCEWESVALTAQGAAATVDSGAERNDGISLAEARANFERYLSMYDPEKLEPWMLGPPSAELLMRKRAFRDSCTALLSEFGRQRSAFGRVQACESALEAQADADRERLHGSNQETV